MAVFCAPAIGRSNTSQGQHSSSPPYLDAIPEVFDLHRLCRLKLYSPERRTLLCSLMLLVAFLLWFGRRLREFAQDAEFRDKLAVREANIFPARGGRRRTQPR